MRQIVISASGSTVRFLPGSHRRSFLNIKRPFVHDREFLCAGLLMPGVQWRHFDVSETSMNSGVSKMRTKTISILTVLALSTIVLTACSAIAKHHRDFMSPGASRAVAGNVDPISGEWDVSFLVHNSKPPAPFTVKLEGTKITGTAYSDHTGRGTIRDGKWDDGRLSFTLDFKKHESIAITGTLKDGKLFGEFTTEGFTEKWEATKK